MALVKNTAAATASRAKAFDLSSLLTTGGVAGLVVGFPFILSNMVDATSQPMVANVSGWRSQSSSPRGPHTASSCLPCATGPTAGGADTLLLTAAVELELEDGTARGRMTLEEGERATFALHHRAGLAQTEFPLLDTARTIEDTAAGWGSWAGQHERYAGAYQQGLASAPARRDG